MQLVYSQNTLGLYSSAVITKAYFRFAKGINVTLDSFTIRMAMVPNSLMSSDYSVFNKQPNLVFGPKTINFVANQGEWTVINLDSTFAYNPNEQLVVQIEQKGFSGTGGPICYLPDPYGQAGHLIIGEAGKATGNAQAKYETDFGVYVTHPLYDAGVAAIDSPVWYCRYDTLKDIRVHVSSFINTIDSVHVGWSVDGIMQPPVLNKVRNSGGPGTGDVLLGKVSVANHKPIAIKAWTFLPNGVKDQIPFNDTLYATITNELDTVPPQIALIGKIVDFVEVSSPSFMSDYADPGISVYDDFDNAIQLKQTKGGSFYQTFPDGKNVNILGTYEIIYHVQDLCGNASSVHRTVKVGDAIRPVITIGGYPVVSICQGAPYTDAGYLAYDNYDSVQYLKIDTFGTFLAQGTHSLPGMYFLRYKATDRSGNEGLSASRTIYVLDSSSSVCTGKYPVAPVQIPTPVLYPNPNNGIFTLAININDSNNYQVSLVNMLGQTENIGSNCNYSQNKLHVDASHQPSGLYFIKIISGSENVCLSVMINR